MNFKEFIIDLSISLLLVVGIVVIDYIWGIR